MRLILAALVLLVSTNAFAQQSRMKRPVVAPQINQLQIYLLSFELRYEKDAAENWLEQKPQNISFAYRATAWSILFEYSKFNESSGNSTLNIERDHKEMVLWGRWHLWRHGQKNPRFSIFGAGGIGTYTEEITTTLASDRLTESTGAKMMGGFAVGADASYQFTKSFGAIASFEGRALMGQDFDPNPTFGGIVRTGLFFAW
ncbi:hypothetical protein [Bdellovibrio sp. HCB288]|uniref:hypothetical protein n=1 Tax=Bdellovibrio sp. HCB288 TaxID=3394355 RepID=UPI0039B39871